MSYFVQNIESQHRYKIDWKTLNALTIALKKIDIGESPDFGELADITKLKESHHYEDTDVLEINDKEVDLLYTE